MRNLQLEVTQSDAEEVRFLAELGPEVKAFLSHAARASSMAKITFKLLERSLPYKAPPAMTVSGQSGSKPVLVGADDLPDVEERETQSQPYMRFVHNDGDASLRGFTQVSLWL